MIFQESATCLDYSNCKDSAIYFEKLVPLNNDVFNELARELKTDLPDLMPNEMANWDLSPFLDGIYLTDPYFMDGHYRKYKSPAAPLILLHHYFESVTQRNGWGPFGLAPSERELRVLYIDHLLEKLHQIRETTSLLPTDAESKINSDGDDVRLTLRNLNLIDTSKASWEQIIELRKDSESLKKLRNLKLFFFGNYKDKPVGYVKEDIQKRMEEYQETAKFWGFDLKLRILESICTSKSLATLGASSVIAAVFGEPSLATIAALTGSTLEIGKIGISIGKAKREQISNLKDHPFEFIFRAEQKFKSS